MTKLYGGSGFEAQGQHYFNHVSAMTGESLHSKSDIAAELAHRDIALLMCRPSVMSNARKLITKSKKMKNWNLYMELFGTGPTTAHKVCIDDLGLDPDGNEASLEVMLKHINKLEGNMETNQEDQMRAIIKKGKVLVHLISELERDMEKLKEEQSRSAHSEWRREQQTISESVTLDALGGSCSATLNYTDGEKASEDTRESGKI